MTEKEERLARDRAEIAARVASFRETQQKFEREREEYYETTLANALNGSGGPRSGVEAELAEACSAFAVITDRICRVEPQENSAKEFQKENSGNGRNEAGASTFFSQVQ